MKNNMQIELSYDESVILRHALAHFCKSESRVVKRAYLTARALSARKDGLRAIEELREKMDRRHLAELQNT